jgi:phosphoglycerol transferase MdoB-like AlkP superfamily enzyme
MLARLRLPKTIVWVFNLLLLFILMFTAFRLITYLAFHPAGEHWDDSGAAFFLGFRYDLRWISIILLPVVSASLQPRFSPFFSVHNRKIWTWYLAIMTFFVFFFFAADFGAFSYNKTRLNASALNFAEDPGISAKMLWQSYPIVWMVLGLIISVLLLRLMFKKLHSLVVARTEGRGIPYQRKWFLASILILGVLAYGRLDRQPLKWTDAFTFDNSFKSYLALNPLQNFFTTLRFRKPQYDEDAVRLYFPTIADWMGLPGTEFSFKRDIKPQIKPVLRPNIVVVLCESFSMYKSSMSGNELNTTPYFKAMCDSGIFFNRCFTPHFSTARGLFAMITGIPDVQLSTFSTRTPGSVNQRTIVNDFEGYQKFYFLGGDPGFNNFRGLISNIKDIQMEVEGGFRSKPVNVWGISDKELFLNANDVFKNERKPFFALIQTADNHRPFTIPATDTDFVKKEIPPEELKNYGFESSAEYNAFRYSDYCFQHFMEAAKKEAYFGNTIFVFVGDHGVSGNASKIYPPVWTEERLTEEHVPLLYYAPKLLAPQKREETVSQIDVLPTLAGIAGIPYQNTTLGRDVLRNILGNHYAFTILHDEGRIGMITDDYFFTKNINFKNEELHFLQHEEAYSAGQKDSIKAKMTKVTTAFYETARWMLGHNKK